MTRTLDDHFFGPGPKRVLALDGGGTRGIISIAFLEKIESVLREQSGRGEDFRLSDYFDLVGGTSVGSLIATLIALGYSVAEIKKVFLDWAPSIFRKPWLGNPITSPKFSSRGLKKRAHKLLKDMTLDSPDLKTGLAVIAKRIDTGSPWVLTNNPKSKYWDDPADHSYLGNKHFRVADLVRASTAAPSYFKPKRIRIVPRHAVPQTPPGLFVDGGVSPFNNPSLMCLMLANMEGYGFNWSLGADNLMIVSVGTGSYRTPTQLEFWKRWVPSIFGAYTLLGMMTDIDALTVTLMQWMSAPKKPWYINSEIEDLKGHFVCHPKMKDSAEPLFTFHRYNVILEETWLNKKIGAADKRTFTKDEIAGWKEMDRPGLMLAIYDQVAVKAATQQVTAEDFPKGFVP